MASKFQKRHYEAILDVIVDVETEFKNNPNIEDYLKKKGPGHVFGMMCTAIITAFGDAFSEDNPNFDAKKFNRQYLYKFCAENNP